MYVFWAILSLIISIENTSLATQRLNGSLKFSRISFLHSILVNAQDSVLYNNDNMVKNLEVGGKFANEDHEGTRFSIK